MMAQAIDVSSETSLDTRVEDYLDDKLRFAADLDGLDDLIANVQLQRDQLQRQLDDAVQDLDAARENADGGRNSLAARIRKFQDLQDSIDTRVQIAAASDAPSQAVARLKKPIREADTISLAHRYLILLQDVYTLREETRQAFARDPASAMAPYVTLKQLCVNLGRTEAGEGLHLVDHVQAVTQSAWDEMRASLSSALESILEQRKWPKVDPELEMDEEWLSAVERLVDLQVPEIVHAPEPLTLLPVELMARIFVSEFRYHFLSDKKTSDPRAMGTHCFPWFVALIEKWHMFFRDNLYHMLVYKFRDTPAALSAPYVDPVCAFVRAMLPVMEEKVWSVLSMSTNKTSLLSSLVPELIAFDETLRSKFRYDGGDAVNGWAGLTSEVLDEHFEIWFDARRESALESFRGILSAPDAHQIDYDFAGEGRMKPTFAAVRITDLLSKVTKEYSQLRKYKHKIRFLIDIQLDILDGYHERLRDSLEAYQSATSTIGRTLHGVSKEQLAALEGTGALETLCKVVGSSDHMVNTLQEWDDEDFFILLWDEVQARRSRDGRDEPDDEDRPSPPFGGASGEESLFEETAQAYGMRCKGGQDLLVRALDTAHGKAFRYYIDHARFITVDDGAALDDASQLAISPDLDHPLDVLRTNLRFLHRALSTASFRRVWRETLGRLQDRLRLGVLLKQEFSLLGALQFRHDVSAITSLVESYIPGGSDSFAALKESLVLLTLPNGAAAGEGDNDAREEGVTFDEANTAAFEGNPEAREVLAALQLRSLAPQGAREVLQRRIENSKDVAAPTW